MTTKRRTLRKTHRMALSLGRRLPALTADVSRGGFAAELPQVFMPGSKVDGFFLVNESEVPFHGTVQWAVPGDPQASIFSRIGVRFDKTPPGLVPVFRALEKSPKRLRAAALSRRGP